jgi:hypothetical protein
MCIERALGSIRCALKVMFRIAKYMIQLEIIIKYLRHDLHSKHYWLNNSNMSVYIRGQRLSVHACTFSCFKIFSKINIKQLPSCLYHSI